MSYVALYRKYRSQTFDDVIGQEPIIKTLRNAISLNRLAHAYLFSGPRGTGKTSVARILAKALNCKNGPTADPCGKCDQCKKIRDGSAVDVFEIDAASNRGIDEIRDLREKVRYAPVEGKYKVYIIDEVHMLTSEAFNALLKTLEEPPQNTIFVLATTEPQKVPPTISSRCQRLDFARIPLLLVSQRLSLIAKNEGFGIEDKALNLIARTGEGSMRDAISLLDQLISFSGKTIKFDDVLLVLGSVDEEFLFKTVEAIGSGDIKTSLSLIEKAVEDGRSIPQITRDLVGHIRYILLAKLGSGSVIDLNQEYIDRVKGDAEKFSVEALTAVIRMLSKAELDMRWHPHPRLILEVALTEASQSAKTKSEESAPEGKWVKMGTKDAERPVRAPVAEPPRAQSKPSSIDGIFTRIRENWPKILESVKKKSLFSYVSLHEGAPIGLSDKGSLIIAFKKGFSFHKDRLEEKNNKSAVEASLAEILGQKVLIECVVSEDIPKQEPVAPKEHGGGVDIDSVKNLFSGRIVPG